MGRREQLKEIQGKRRFFSFSFFSFLFCFNFHIRNNIPESEWLEMNMIEPFIDHLTQEIKKMINGKIFCMETFMKLTLVVLILSMPPGRPQNYRLIHSDNVKLSHSSAHFLVENENEKIKNYKRKMSGIICTVRIYLIHSPF